MDDECVEELGRPISSLKVSDLRDELQKRSLVKTGKKNELIDRLRQAISKQATSTQQSAVAQPPDLTVQQGSGALSESAIDYSTPQTNTQIMTSSQQQVSIPATDIDKYSPSNKDLNHQMHQDEVLKAQEEGKAQEELAADQMYEVEQVKAEELRKQEEQMELERQRQIDEQKQTEAEKVHKADEELPIVRSEAGQQKSEAVEEKVDGLIGADQLEPEAESTKETGSEETDRPAQPSDLEEKTEPEPAAPVTFTLKRGNRDNGPASRLEKRRKWSGKSSSEMSQASSESSLVSGGISSQKLQELIDLKQVDGKDTNTKSSSPKSSSNANSDRSSDLKSQKSERKSTDNVEKSAINLNEDADLEKDNTKHDSKNEVNNDEKINASDEQSVEQSKEPTKWLAIRNLMRPYTVTQLKEELTKFGPIVDDKFWTDKVKSKCCVLYETIEAAQQTKSSLQGQQWPISNPKSLVIDFITEEQYKDLIEADTKPPPQPAKKSDGSTNRPVNGGSDKHNKQNENRLADRLETAEVGSSSLKQRLGGKVGGDDRKLNRLDTIDLQPKELDELFNKTRAKPQLFWLPLDEEQAEARVPERQERDRRAQELSQKALSRRSPPPAPRRRSPNLSRRSPPRHRSPRRSPPRRRASPVRRRTPPQQSRRSPPRRRLPPSPRNSPPPRRRTPPRDHSPLLKRRPSPRNSPPPMRRRTPQRDSPPPMRRRTPQRDSPPPMRRRTPQRDSPPPMRRRTPQRDSPPPFRRRTPLRDSPPPFRRRTPIRDSPPPIRRRSPSPLLRRRTPPRDSPPMRRRSPEPGRRSPLPYNRRPQSPNMMRRSPGPIRHMSPGRRSPVIIRRSPGMMRRSPGPSRRSPGPIRRSPEPMRRSPPPGQMRRSRGAARDDYY